MPAVMLNKLNIFHTISISWSTLMLVPRQGSQGAVPLSSWPLSLVPNGLGLSSWHRDVDVGGGRCELSKEAGLGLERGVPTVSVSRSFNFYLGMSTNHSLSKIFAELTTLSVVSKREVRKMR